MEYEENSGPYGSRGPGVLGACNTQNANGNAGKYTVTVSVAFPQRQPTGSGLTPQGVPESAAEADVTVYDAQNTVVSRATLTRQNSSASFTLPQGTYDFEVSVWSTTSVDGQQRRFKEVAWNREQHAISQDASILLKPRAILGDAWIDYFPGSDPYAPAELFPGDELNFLLAVGAPGEYPGVSFPVDDYDVEYVIGTCTQVGCTDFTPVPSEVASIVSKNKTGLRIRAGNVSQDIDLYVKATIGGLGEDHSSTTKEVFSSRPARLRSSSPPSPPSGVWLDMDPPQINLISPTLDPSSYRIRVSTGQTVNFSARVTDAASGIAIDTVRAFIDFWPVDQSNITYTYTSARRVEFQFPFTPSRPGYYIVELVASDLAGNSTRYLLLVEAQ